ncbi:uncharacterized protein LOC143201945 isoform X1 [Rhynchophorus ferrugineus]|uniref:uncharacterized protein LOC143201945 isoform X1 n=1 Tax=Rhynchophorus ferrugineus TaxID=354439 RepID=UPI003FCD0944
MSDLTEEFLNEDDGDFADVAEADEEALLQDDEDVLNLVPEEDLGETIDEPKTGVTQTDSNRADREKFSSERQKAGSSDSTKFRQQPGDRGKGFRRQNIRQNGRGNFTHGRRFFNRNNAPGKNKTVLINPRFQGIVHVNNNARLAWDNTQGMPQQHCPVNPWSSGGMGPPIQPPPHMQHFSDHPNQNMQPLQFVPPHQQTFVPQPLHQGMHSHAPMQSLQNQPYWDTPNNQYPPIQGHNQWPFPGQAPSPDNYMQNNFQGPPPILINTNQPPPQFPPHNHQNQSLNFVPPRPNFPNNSNMNHYRNYNQGYKERAMNRKNSGGNFLQNRKNVHERLGVVKPSQTKQKSIRTDERPHVVTEVRLTNVTPVKIEEDEETRDLRLKIEEQKRKREEVFKWKEERRLQKLKQVSPEVKLVVEAAEPQQEQKVSPQQFKMKKRANNIVVTNGYSKKVTKYQRNVKNANVSTASDINSEVVQVKQEPDLELDPKHLSSFLADRKVLTKDETLMSTRKVVIKNISTSTTNKKIIQICANIGEVQNLQRDINERQATILFKSVASAHNFFKRYQRHMLDLSMIEVSLSPMSESE